MAKSLALSVRNIYETLAISVPTVLDAARGRIRKETLDARLTHWSSRIVENCRIDLRVDGRENFDLTRTFVVMSNHQSFYDVPVLYAVLGGNLRMVAKKELFHFPIFGRAMREAAFIEIDRQSRESAMASIKKAQETLARGVNVWIAPEGTRSATGEMLPFKKGGFYLAFESGLPILPVTLKGTRDVLAAHDVLSEANAHVTVTIAPPIETASFLAQGKAGREELMNVVRTVIGSAL